MMGKRHDGGRGNDVHRGGNKIREAELRRLALRLTGKLPSDTAEARTVLNYMLVLLNDYMDGDQEDEQKQPSRPSLRLISTERWD